MFIDGVQAQPCHFEKIGVLISSSSELDLPLVGLKLCAHQQRVSRQSLTLQCWQKLSMKTEQMVLVPGMEAAM